MKLIKSMKRFLWLVLMMTVFITVSVAYSGNAPPIENGITIEYVVPSEDFQMEAAFTAIPEWEINQVHGGSYLICPMYILSYNNNEYLTVNLKNRQLFDVNVILNNNQKQNYLEGGTVIYEYSEITQNTILTGNINS